MLTITTTLESLRGNNDVPISALQLLASAREDIGRLMSVLRHLNCIAGLRTDDGAFLAFSGEHGMSCLDRSSSSVLSSPIVDPQGRTRAALELRSLDGDISDPIRTLLGISTQAAARALAERWFRIHYRQNWVLLASQVAAPDTAIMLALDDARRVVGANAAARHMISAGDLHFNVGIPAEALFQLDRFTLSTRRYSDSITTLRAVADGEAWAVMTTPPATGCYSVSNERSVLHARPRHDALRYVDLDIPVEPAENGLPPRILRRVEEYIDANLDQPLNVDNLAAGVGISTSHFARCFRISLGLTPHSYVMRRRLVRAQTLLTSTNLALSEVALSAGFSDQSHFSRRFHQFMGVPPRSFRMQHR